LPCKSPDSPGNLLAHAASLKIQPIQWGGDGAYIKATFLDPSSPLHNEEHAHLAHAEIGFLWTVVENSHRLP
ncbi:hypothetical protein CN080_32760, partial [Sinorhizobium meliloti]